MGRAFSSLGDIEKAVSCYEAAIGIDPNYVDPRINLGTLLLQKREWRQSLERFHQVLRINGNNTKTHNNIGVIMLYQGRTEDAVAQFRAALRVDPDYAMAKKNLDIALNRRGSPAAH